MGLKYSRNRYLSSFQRPLKTLPTCGSCRVVNRQVERNNNKSFGTLEEVDPCVDLEVTSAPIKTAVSFELKEDREIIQIDEGDYAKQFDVASEKSCCTSEVRIAQIILERTRHDYAIQRLRQIEAEITITELQRQLKLLEDGCANSDGDQTANVGWVCPSPQPLGITKITTSFLDAQSSLPLSNELDASDRCSSKFHDLSSVETEGVMTTCPSSEAISYEGSCNSKAFCLKGLHYLKTPLCSRQRPKIETPELSFSPRSPPASPDKRSAKTKVSDAVSLKSDTSQKNAQSPSSIERKPGFCSRVCHCAPVPHDTARCKVCATMDLSDTPMLP